VIRQPLARDELSTLSHVAAYTQNLVVITDARGWTEWINDAFITRTGYTLADLAGRKPGEVLQGPETDRAAVARISALLSEGRPFDAELLNYTRSGEPYWVQMHITPIFDSGGEVERFISIQTDCTELRRTQAALQVATARAELANEAKTEFLATISHEMRTPLNAILGSTELAVDDAGDPAMVRAHLVRISEASTLLKRLITDILDVSKIEAGQIDVQIGPVDIRACLDAALAPVAGRARAKGIGFAVTFDDAVPATLLTDGERLRQIVANLAENAVKFTDRGDVRVEVLRAAAVRGDDTALEIRVVDSGTGIPAGEEDHIFERFVQGDASITRRRGGAGLGLGIAKSLAQALGGTVTAGNRAEGGAEFRVTLPLVVAAEPAAPAVPSRTARILVAEDNDVNYAMFEAYLERNGFSVERALDGEEAVAGAADCDLILMDVEMPGMDGLEATRRIRASEADRGARPTPVLAITAHAIQEYRERCLDAGCTGYLTKPVGMQTLVDAVAGALAAAG